VLLTGAFDFLVAPFTEAQAIASWRATVVAFRSGRCEGAIDGVELIGEEKLHSLQSLFAGQKVDWAASWAYGDEEGDLSLLARVGHPVWVKSHRPIPCRLSPACSLLEWDA
jgi:phosphoserine phosphatase